MSIRALEIKSKSRAVIFLAALFLWAGSGEASAATKAASLDPAPGLSQTWLNLSFYHQTRTGGYRSEIVNPSFFLSEEGRTDPQTEYRAFVNAVLSELEKGSSSELACRYPARTRFAVTAGALPEELLEHGLCPGSGLMKEAPRHPVVNLVFATGYFSNPSSYYGHVLLQVSDRDARADISILDRAINFGADITHKSSNPLYLVNGIFGGYQAHYQSNSFFLHNHNYLNRQLRDVWTFKLKLTEDQARFVLEHAQELTRAEFDYYFFNDNCAHKIAEILEHATGEDLKASPGFWFMPFQLVENLRAAGRLEEGRWQESRKSKLARVYEEMAPDHQRQFTDWVERTARERQMEAGALAPAALVMAQEYLDFESAAAEVGDQKSEELRQDIEATRQALLKQMLRSPEKEALRAFMGDMAAAPEPEKTPFDNPLPASISLRMSASENGNWSEVSFRPANNDLLDQLIPGTPPSDFSMGTVTLEANEEGVGLRGVEGITITNLVLSPIPAPLFGEGSALSWGLEVGYLPHEASCLECSSFSARYETGYAARFGSSVWWGMVGGRVMESYRGRGNFGLTLAGSGLWDITHQDRLMAKVEAEYLPEPGDTLVRWSAALSHRIDRRTALRLEVFDDDNTRVAKLSLVIGIE